MSGIFIYRVYDSFETGALTLGYYSSRKLAKLRKDKYIEEMKETYETMKLKPKDFIGIEKIELDVDRDENV